MIEIISKFLLWISVSLFIAALAILFAALTKQSKVNANMRRGVPHASVRAHGTITGP
jgi:hypothetical protein